jgi:O-antigen/teichoic acid export membrane protein
LHRLPSAKNKLIAKNTLLLYVRMMFTMGVGLYTSRIILKTLGIEDYGIYNVVASVVVIFTFLNSSLSGASSRFLTYELGCSDLVRLKKVFSATLTIHIGVAIIFFVIAETIGIWFLENKLVIPTNRMFAARIVYQLSILSCMITITQVPYNASIIAHEQFNVFAFVGIIESLLKLFIVFLLLMFGVDKLILYSILVLLVSAIIAIIYRIFCTTHFEECTYKFSIEKDIIKPILSFSLWDLYGNFSLMTGNQGINILQNMFFGPVVNAANAIAIQVQGVISNFASNFLTSVKPQIVKNYASKDMDEMLNLIFNSSKFSFCLILMFSLPLVIENNFILHVWLTVVPNYTVVFCQVAIINSLISTLFNPIGIAIHATGKIKRLSLISGTIYLMALPISFAFLKFGASPVVPIVTYSILLIFASSYNLLILNRYMKLFSIKLFFKKVIFSSFLISVLSAFFPLLLFLFLPSGWFRFLLVGFVSVIFVIITTYLVGMDQEMKSKAKYLIFGKMRLVFLK